jgi:hypothetical protein
MNFYARAWPARIPTSLISREAQLQTLQRYDATAGSASAHVIARAIGGHSHFLFCAKYSRNRFPPRGVARRKNRKDEQSHIMTSRQRRYSCRRVGSEATAPRITSAPSSRLSQGLKLLV